MKKIYFTVFILSFGFLSQAQQISTSEFGQVITGSNPENSSTSSRLNEDPVLWEQPVSTADNKYSIVSTYYMQNDWGLYSADDFEVENNVTINSILFFGSQYNEDAQNLIDKVNFYFYLDNEGVPAGSPEEQGSELRKYSFNYDQLTVEPGVDAFLGNKIYHIDLKEILNDGIDLEAGHYWLSIVFDIDMDANNFDDRFSWSDSETLVLNQPKAISTELGINEWTSVPEIGFPVQAFAFSLYGEEEILSTSAANLQNLQVYPNPAVNAFYIVGSSVEQIKEVSATNTLGQTTKLLYNNGKVDVSHLSKGLYIIQIKTSQGELSQKIIKK